MGYPRPTVFPSTPGLHQVATSYKWDEDGAAAGTHKLPGLFPAGAIILSVIFRVVTQTASANNTATVAFTLGGRTIKAASLPAVWDPDAGIQVTGIDEVTADEPFLLAEAGQLAAVTAVQTLTAGEIHVHVRYTMSVDFDYEQSETPV